MRRKEVFMDTILTWASEHIDTLVWLAVIIVATVVEAQTLALVSIWFIPSAAVSLILSFCRVNIGIQIAVFAVLSFILLIFSRKIFGKTLRIKPVATNADSLIGEHAVVTEDINNIEGRGAAKVRGLEWSARSADGENIEAGTVVLVTGIEGVKLMCKKDKSDKN